MVNQVLLSFKIDKCLLDALDSLCLDLNVKRNRLLNFLVAYAIDELKDVSKLNMIRVYSSCF